MVGGALVVIVRERWMDLSSELQEADQALLDSDPYEGWPAVRVHLLLAECLDSACLRFLTGQADPLVGPLLVRAQAIEHRAVSDGALGVSPTVTVRPWAEVMALRCQLFTTLLLGSEIDPSRLGTGARRAADWALQDIHENGKGGMWRAAEPFAAAVRLALLAGDVPFAREVLAQEIRGVSEGAAERRWLRAIADDPEGLGDGASLRTLFDKLRDPTDRLPGLADLERALVWDLYVTNPGGPVDLSRAAAVYTA